MRQISITPHGIKICRVQIGPQFQVVQRRVLHHGLLQKDKMLAIEVVGKVFFLLLGILSAFVQCFLLLLDFYFALGIGSLVLLHPFKTFQQRAFGANHGVSLGELSRFDICLYLPVEVVQLVIVSAHIAFCHLVDKVLARLAVLPKVAYQGVVLGLRNGMGIPQRVQFVLLLANLALHNITNTLAGSFEVGLALFHVLQHHYQRQVFGISVCLPHCVGVGQGVPLQLSPL